MVGKQVIIDDCPYQGECSISGCKRNDDGCFVRQLFEERDRAEKQIIELNKTIQAKEQECERLKKKLKPKLKNAHCVYFDGQTGWCNAKEFIRCNPIGCKLYTIDELSTIVDLQQQLDQLKVENEELKKWKENVINLFDKTCRCKYLNEESTYCSFYNKECIAINQCLYKNQQTLTEIKPTLELYASSKIGEEQLDGTYKITVKNSSVLGDTYITFDPRPAKQALQKISECEVKND